MLNFKAWPLTSVHSKYSSLGLLVCLVVVAFMGIAEVKSISSTKGCLTLCFHSHLLPQLLLLPPLSPLYSTPTSCLRSYLLPQLLPFASTFTLCLHSYLVPTLSPLASAPTLCLLSHLLPPLLPCASTPTLCLHSYNLPPL